MCSSDLNNLIENPTTFFVCGCLLQAGSASCGCVRFDTIINQIYLQELTKTLKRNCHIDYEAKNIHIVIQLMSMKSMFYQIVKSVIILYYTANMH